jgi:uncharacterized protein with PQ loop repeat
MNVALPVVAGAISTAVFALSALPMLVKAARTKDMTSYSLGNIVLSNVGNVVHSIYVFHLPAGPVWVLHSFYLVSTGLMLLWYLRYAPRGGGASQLRQPGGGRYTEIATSCGRTDLGISTDSATPTAP